jgi:cytochrome c biogenesis protein CcdA
MASVVLLAVLSPPIIPMIPAAFTVVTTGGEPAGAHRSVATSVGSRTGTSAVVPAAAETAAAVTATTTTLVDGTTKLIHMGCHSCTSWSDASGTTRGDKAV